MDFDKIMENSAMIVLSEQNGGKVIEINLIKQIITKFGPNLVLYNKKYNKSFYSNSLLKAYLTKAMTSLKTSNQYYYKDDDISSILKFRIQSITTDKRGCKQIQLTFIKEHKRQENEAIPLSDSEKTDDEKAIRMQTMAKDQHRIFDNKMKNIIA